MIYEGPTKELIGFIPSSLQMLSQSEALVAIMDVRQGQWKQSRLVSFDTWSTNVLMLASCALKYCFVLCRIMFTTCTRYWSHIIEERVRKINVFTHTSCIALAWRSVSLPLVTENIQNVFVQISQYNFTCKLTVKCSVTVSIKGEHEFE